MAFTTNIYLNFPGTTEEAFTFYKSIFGGEFSALMRFKEVPDAGVVSAEDGEKIMHISMPLGNIILMATDSLESMGQKIEYGNNTYVSVHPETKEEADRIFAALSDGAEIEMPIADVFWGDYFGSLKDKYGIRWMIDVGPTAAK